MDEFSYDKLGNITYKNGMGNYEYKDPAHKHAVTHIDGQLKYGYDKNGNMVVRKTKDMSSIQYFDAENKVAGIAYLGDTTFTDDFSSKKIDKWAYNSSQRVPLNHENNNVVEQKGSGNNYESFYRKNYDLRHGKGIKVRFKVDQPDTASHFCIVANDPVYKRIGIIAHGNKLYVQYRTDDSG